MDSWYATTPKTGIERGRRRLCDVTFGVVAFGDGQHGGLHDEAVRCPCPCSPLPSSPPPAPAILLLRASLRCPSPAPAIPAYLDPGFAQVASQGPHHARSGSMVGASPTSVVVGSFAHHLMLAFYSAPSPDNGVAGVDRNYLGALTSFNQRRAPSATNSSGPASCPGQRCRSSGTSPPSVSSHRLRLQRLWRRQAAPKRASQRSSSSLCPAARSHASRLGPGRRRSSWRCRSALLPRSLTRAIVGVTPLISAS